MAKYHYSDGSVLDCFDFSRTLHRLDGPAVEYGDYGYREWHQNGLLHRLSGPAMEYADGTKRWYINGKEFTQEEFDKTILIMQLSGLLNE